MGCFERVISPETDQIIKGKPNPSVLLFFSLDGKLVPVNAGVLQHDAYDPERRGLAYHAVITYGVNGSSAIFDPSLRRPREMGLDEYFRRVFAKSEYCIGQVTVPIEDFRKRVQNGGVNIGELTRNYPSGVIE
jgi:hypothetical protein